MNLTPLKQVTNVINGVIRIQLPKGFDAKRVELTIAPLDDKATPLSGFQQFLLDSLEMTEFFIYKSSNLFHTLLKLKSFTQCFYELHCRNTRPMPEYAGSVAKAGADYFLTTDKGILNKATAIKGINITDPIDFIREVSA